MGPRPAIYGATPGPPVTALLPVKLPPGPTAALMEVAMAFREVRVYEVKEVLRLWLRGKGTRPIPALVGLDRNTVSATSPPWPKRVGQGRRRSRPGRRANGQGMRGGPSPPTSWARVLLVHSPGPPWPAEGVAAR
jgi:hypothetical protein